MLQCKVVGQGLLEVVTFLLKPKEKTPEKHVHGVGMKGREGRENLKKPLRLKRSWPLQRTQRGTM